MIVEEARQLVHEGVMGRCDEYHDDDCVECPPLTDRLILEVQAAGNCPAWTGGKCINSYDDGKCVRCRAADALAATV